MVDLLFLGMSCCVPSLAMPGLCRFLCVYYTLIHAHSIAEVAGLVARPLPLGEMARVVAQLGCDRGLHQHVPLRVQSVLVVGRVNVLVDTAM